MLRVCAVLRARAGFSEIPLTSRPAGTTIPTAVAVEKNDDEEREARLDELQEEHRVKSEGVAERVTSAVERADEGLRMAKANLDAAKERRVTAGAKK